MPMREIALAITVFVALVLLVETVAGLLLASRSQVPVTTEITKLYPIEDHPDYGWVLQAGIRHRATKAFESGRTCYDVIYRTDVHHRRTVAPPSDVARQHLLLFGGSTTMGEGLADEETLQFFLGRFAPEYGVHNYAVHGYGPAHALALLESGELPRQVFGKTGRAVYIMIPEHVSRVTGDTRAFWVYAGPHYVRSGDSVSRRGSFRTGRPWTTALYEGFLRFRPRSNLLEILHFELPPQISRGAVDLTARVLTRARDLYARQFEGELVVVLHPSWNRGHPRSAEIHRWIVADLKSAGVEVLDYSREGPLQEDERIDPHCDQHPSGILNEKLAVAIARDLRSGR